MVRLKVICNSYINVSIFISIPYGAIKSKSVVNNLYTRSNISIPYGAIKSKKYFRQRKGIYIFQFLMVRLKVSLVCNL